MHNTDNTSRKGICNVIAQNENIQCDAPAAQVRTPPRIESEIDIPFGGTLTSYQEPRQDNLSKTDSLDEQITKFKYMTGKTVLFISMGAMGIAVLISIILSACEIKNSLVENAFEVFKLIAMTVLGYIFGSKTK